MDNKDLIYRQLNCDDLDLFIKLRLDFLTELHNEIAETEKEKIIASLQKYFVEHSEKKDFIGIVCEYKGNVVSTAFLAINERPANNSFTNGKIGTVINVYTYPEYRKNGIATNLLKKLLEEARKRDVFVIELLATQSGEKVYKKTGFRETEYKCMRLHL